MNKITAAAVCALLLVALSAGCAQTQVLDENATGSLPPAAQEEPEYQDNLDEALRELDSLETL